MKNAIIVHGTCSKDEYYSDYSSASNAHWFPWLQNELLRKDIHAVTPEMFQGYMPNYEHWKIEFERYDVTPETILVGHSCGGGFLVRWLSENSEAQVGKVVLVAPWFDPNKTKGEDNDFFDFEIDRTLLDRTAGITIFNSTNDEEAVHTTVKQIQSAISGIKYTEFKDMGHFCLDDFGGEAFPELLEETIS
jgi:predicted alpha/beta hydrolase family esterase